jgi:hypothetical protein
LKGLVDNFEKIMVEGPNPRKKDILRRLVKRIVVHDRRTVEVWYGLPNRGGGASTVTIGSPNCGQIRTSPPPTESRATSASSTAGAARFTLLPLIGATSWSELNKSLH